MRRTLLSFVTDRQPAWDELDALVASARGRVERLDAPGIRRLDHLHRSAVADLAFARRCYPADPIVGRLAELVGRSRPLLLGTVRARGSVRAFAATGYWRRVVERPAFLAISALLLFAPGLAVGLWAHHDPAGGVALAQISPLTAGIAEDGPRDPDDLDLQASDSAAFSSQIFTNNARVALVAYAGGLTAGVATGFMLAFNGLVLGLVAGLAVAGGQGDALVRLVVPHGVLELSLIVVAGAAGLRTGWALLRPGHRTRTEALADEGRAGVEMALGSAALLVPCGLVEGFVTPLGLPAPGAIAVGVGLGLAFWGCVLWRGRIPRSTSPA